METSGELVALTTSNELVPIVRGLSAPAAIALDPEGGAIWIAERGAGRVVRLRRR
jgi:streptogramin lyase